MARGNAGRAGRALLTVGLLLVAAAVAVLVAMLVLDSGDDGRADRSGQGLVWPAPELRDPETIEVGDDRSLELDPARDYDVRLPSEPLSGPSGLTITGGRNVTLVGGAIEIPEQGPEAGISERRGLLLKDQTGTVHVEGVSIGGDGLSEGINLDQRAGAIVQLQNIRVEELHARDERNFSDNHPDVLQTWAGPAELRVDRLTGVTNYQGIFLHPEQFGDAPRRVDLRRVNITSEPTAHYLLWRATDFPVKTRQVWVDPPQGRPKAQTLWPSPEAWPGVRTGRPPGGDFVPVDAVGVDYGRR